MSMDLFIARTMITKASLVYKGAIDITENQVISSDLSIGIVLYLFFSPLFIYF